MHSRPAQCLRCLMVWIVLLGVAAGSHAQLAFEVKDINTTRPRGLRPPFMSELATLGSSIFFALDDGGTGAEVWKLDGATGTAALFKDICPGSCSSLPISFIPFGGLLFFLADDGVHGYELWKTDGTVSGTVMVRDIYPGRNPGVGGRLTNFNGVLYFPASDGVHGLELWRSDGTPSGTTLVADFHPGPSPFFFGGPASSSPLIQASSPGKFLFTVFDAVYGTEPWIGDGTVAGTHRIRDLNPGPSSSMRSGQTSDGDEPALALPDGTFLFVADDGAHGRELWRTDGTDAGTFLVKDINPGTFASEPDSFELLNGKGYFAATTQATGSELWVTDGTEAGTALVKDLVAGTTGSRPERLTVANGRLFFRVGTQEFWTSDGTAAGTVRLGSSGALLALGELGGSVLALTGSLGLSPLLLWQTDGTPAGTVLLKNLGFLDNRCLFGQPDLRQVDGELFFYGCRLEPGLELWKTDGTPGGTVLVKSQTRTPSLPPPDQFNIDTILAPWGDGLFFSANDGVAGAQLWYTNGSPGTAQPVPGIPPSTSPWPTLGIIRPVPLGSTLLYPYFNGLFRLDGAGAGSQLLAATTSFYSPPAGNLFFFGNTTPETGKELWKTDGTVAGTSITRDINPGPGSTSFDFGLRQPLGSQLLFNLSDTLWRSDGTEAGTLMLRDFLPGSSSEIRHTAVLGDTFFVVVLDDSSFRSLWKTDGTLAGTVRVKIFDQGPSTFGAVINGILPAGNRIYLRVDDGIHGEEIWVSDGTEAGTHLLKDVRPGAEPSFLQWWTVPGQSLLYFIANDGTHGQEVWVSDGTEAGTRLLKDIWPGAESPFIDRLFTPGQSLFYFTAEDGTHGRELWVSDGTGAGTRMVKDILSGAGSSGVGTSLLTVQGRFFFTADDGVHGTELWVSDGTEAGTRMVADVLPGPQSSLPSNLASLGRTLVFTASDGPHGAEPWVTSGTETGTFMLQDLAPGTQSSGPLLYTSAPPYVYFIADDGTSGTELWAARKAALEPTFDDVHSTYWAWPYVEAIAAAGLTTGCGESLYCPFRPVTRAEMAVFVLRMIHGAGYAPPDVSTSRFADVSSSHWALDWIEQLATEGITSGCGVSPPLYCPESPTARDQMAVFLLRALHGSGYTPPPATGTVFTDVPASYWAAAWIEQLAAEGITTGCGANLYCPGDPVSRDQMAVFLTRALDLPLP